MQPHKEIERHYLHSFRYLCRDFPSGDLRNHETPDFLVVTETQRKIGIEITRVFKADGKTKNSQQSVEATKEAITVFARMYSECLNLPPVDVSLLFSLRRPLNAKAQREIALRVAQVVHDNMPFQGESVTLEYGIGGRRDQPIEVDLICINRVHPVDRHQWTWPEMGDVQTDVITLLQRAINTKTEKLDACLRCCDECWLLIVAPSFKPSGMIHPDKHSLSHAYASRFSRTYFLDFGHGRLVRL